MPQFIILLTYREICAFLVQQIPLLTETFYLIILFKEKQSS